MSDERSTKRDMVLPPGTYAYMQDVTKGVIKTYTGPTVINPTAQEVPVIYNPDEGRFEKVDLESAVRRAVIAPEGYYIILLNPAKGDAKQPAHPSEGQTQASADLDVGRKVVIPGPAMFPLWPGQAAQVIRGHQLRYNQYILARIYNEEEAQKNWGQAIMKPAAQTGGDGGDSGLAGGANDTKVTLPPKHIPDLSAQPQNFTVGTEIIIRGDQVSFYIPPTGIAVVKDGESYVRDALTLERLEYAILVDENGNKRYEEGPQVVFPRPSEKFIEKDDDGKRSRKFRAIELNEIQGIHIKVIADYSENGVDHKAGDELFITGKDTAIYYPREEHSAIKYDGKTKHFATAIPAGEGRYVMNRKTGEIRTVKGPFMLLPDPRTEVIVRRTLTDKQATLWYPGNQEVREYNAALRALLQNAPTTRQGVLSEGDITRGAKSRGQNKALVSSVESSRTSGLMADGFSSQTYGTTANAMMNSSQVSGDQNMVGDEFSRASTYNQPRTVDLNTKFQGAPSIDIWTGYACMVVSKTGKRRVEKGPTNVILDYDESLEVLELSMGKPKTTDQLMKTVYLRVENNKVSDKITVETADHVKVELYLSYRINFDGDTLKWFSVENYVKFACDHFRSLLKGAVRKLKVEEFYANSTDIVRNILLNINGTDKKGLSFSENNMVLDDVEVLGVTLMDERIRTLLDNSQQEVVKSNIELSNLARKQTVLEQTEELSRREMAIRAETKKLQDKTSLELLASQLSVSLSNIANKIKETEQERAKATAAEELLNFNHAQALQREMLTATQKADIRHAAQEIELAQLDADTKAIVSRFKASQEGFAEALVALSDKEVMVKVAQAWSIQRAIGGENVSDALSRVFQGTPLEGLAKRLVEKSANGASLTTAPTS